jgi:serine/threonine-protein kinase
VVAKHLNVEAEAPSSKASQEIPPELDAAILRCLAKKPEDRFPDMESFSDALAALPFDPPWSSDRAREWWIEHPPATGTSKPAMPTNSPESDGS